MALLTGSVTIAPDGSRTGSGFALRIYDFLTTALDIEPFDVPGNVPSAQEQVATFAEAFAQAIVDEFHANAVVNIPALTVNTTGTAAAQSGTSVPSTGTIT